MGQIPQLKKKLTQPVQGDEEEKKNTFLSVDTKLTRCEKTDKTCGQLWHPLCKIIIFCHCFFKTSAVLESKSVKDIPPLHTYPRKVTAIVQTLTVPSNDSSTATVHGVQLKFFPYVWHLKLPEIFIGKLKAP